MYATQTSQAQEIVSQTCADNEATKQLSLHSQCEQHKTRWWPVNEAMYSIKIVDMCFRIQSTTELNQKLTKKHAQKTVDMGHLHEGKYPMQELWG